MTAPAHSLQTVLLVDDEPPVREIIAHGLRLHGFDVTTAEDGKQAMTLLKARAFELVITDINMPEADGLELITFLRKMASRPAVIAMSGGGSYMTAKLSLECAVLLGARLPLVKPFSLQHLLDVIAALGPSGEKGK